MSAWVHRLLSKDLAAGTAICTACGPVDLFWKGPGKTNPRCAVAARQQKDTLNRNRKGGVPGLTPAEARARCAGKACAICGTTACLGNDHCHQTGILRDVLCNNCNRGLGLFSDSPERLRAAAAYLEWWLTTP